MSRSHFGLLLYAIWSALFFVAPVAVFAQSNSGIVQGTVTDPQKAVVPGAKVRLENPVSGHVNEAQTGADGICITSCRSIFPSRSWVQTNV